MVSGSGNNINTSQELVIYEPMIWDLIYAGEEVNCFSAMVCAPLASITQLYPPSKRQKKMLDSYQKTETKKK
jgi:hypothetical protein